MKCVEKYRLSEHKYLVAFEECLCVATTDDNGEIIRTAIFGANIDAKTGELKRREQDA